MTIATPKRPTPRVFAHANRADWGRAVISDELPDRKTFVFENVGVRTFMNGSPVIIEVDVPQEERNALAAALIRESGAVAPKKKKASTKKPKVAKVAKAAAAPVAAS